MAVSSGIIATEMEVLVLKSRTDTFVLLLSLLSEGASTSPFDLVTFTATTVPHNDRWNLLSN